MTQNFKENQQYKYLIDRKLKKNDPYVILRSVSDASIKPPSGDPQVQTNFFMKNKIFDYDPEALNMTNWLVHDEGKQSRVGRMKKMSTKVQQSLEHYSHKKPNYKLKQQKYLDLKELYRSNFTLNKSGNAFQPTSNKEKPKSNLVSSAENLLGYKEHFHIKDPKKFLNQNCEQIKIKSKRNSINAPITEENMSSLEPSKPFSNIPHEPRSVEESTVVFMKDNQEENTVEPKLHVNDNLDSYQDKNIQVYDKKMNYYYPVKSRKNSVYTYNCNLPSRTPETEYRHDYSSNTNYDTTMGKNKPFSKKSESGLRIYPGNNMGTGFCFKQTSTYVDSNKQDIKDKCIKSSHYRGASMPEINQNYENTDKNFYIKMHDQDLSYNDNLNYSEFLKQGLQMKLRRIGGETEQSKSSKFDYEKFRVSMHFKPKKLYTGQTTQIEPKKKTNVQDDSEEAEQDVTEIKDMKHVKEYLNSGKSNFFSNYNASCDSDIIDYKDYFYEQNKTVRRDYQKFKANLFENDYAFKNQKDDKKFIAKTSESLIKRIQSKEDEKSNEMFLTKVSPKKSINKSKVSNKHTKMTSEEPTNFEIKEFDSGVDFEASQNEKVFGIDKPKIHTNFRLATNKNWTMYLNNKPKIHTENNLKDQEEKYQKRTDKNIKKDEFRKQTENSNSVLNSFMTGLQHKGTIKDHPYFTYMGKQLADSEATSVIENTKTLDFEDNLGYQSPKVSSRQIKQTPQVNLKKAIVNLMHVCTERNSVGVLVIESMGEMEKQKKDKRKRIIHRLIKLSQRVKECNLSFAELVDNRILDVSNISMDPVRTKLFIDIRAGEEEPILRVLDKNKQLIYSRDSTGSTPQHLAVKRKNFSLVQLLQKYQPFIDEFDFYDCPPLYYAVEQGDVNLVKLLLMDKANPYVPKVTEALKKIKDARIIDILRLAKAVHFSVNLAKPSMRKKMWEDNKKEWFSNTTIIGFKSAYDGDTLFANSMRLI